ncbi:MAG: nucleoside:proton symporter, partial [Gammaproteobacteria bacterium]|nr:nucleoside:proton symporter [Gammaproteobacteria bacterium]
NVIGAVVVARVMIPEQGATEDADPGDELRYASVMDAISRGTMDGLRLVVNVGAMVIVLVSLVALVNHVISGLHVAGGALTLERMAGWAFAPVAWLMGIEWAEASFAGTLLGVKVVLNELIAYIQLGAADAGVLSERARLIMTYGLCGFTNFGSVGILIGGLSALVPERRAEVLRLAPRTLISGTIVACMTGAIAGLVTS